MTKRRLIFDLTEGGQPQAVGDQHKAREQSGRDQRIDQGHPLKLTLRQLYESELMPQLNDSNLFCQILKTV